MRFAAILLLLFTFTISPAFAEGEVYTCPMHPHIISETEGTCPICGMDLVALENDVEEDTSGSSTDEKKILYWVAPMNPDYKMDEPGKSPMGMDLVPVYDESVAQDDGEGRVTVRINSETIQNIGVRTEKAKMSEFGSNIRSYGIIAINERLQKEIYSRVDGWISELGVSAVGDNITKNSHLYTIHSPDLVLAQRDLLSLDKSGRKTNLNRLFVHYEVDKKFVEELRKTKNIKQDVPYYSPYVGTVSKLNVRPGSYVTLNTPLMILEDYSSVWVNVSVAEKDLQFLNKGSKAQVTFPNLGGFERTGSIDYIHPTIDADSRTSQVRLVLDNADGNLKPGAYADVEFEANSEKRLSIPSEAILKSSGGDFVVIAKGKGRFQPVKIKTGIINKDQTEVISGISEGDDVVVSSQFMIDSESSLREAFRKMKKPAKAKSATTGDTHAGH